MTNHPNRGARSRIRWVRETTGSLTAIWPEGSYHAGEEWTFSRPGRGYVYCDFGRAENSGTLGRQICYGGSTMGTTISEDDAGFEKAVKKWLADYRRFIHEVVV